MLILASGQVLLTHAFQLIVTISPLIILYLTNSVTLAGLAIALVLSGRIIVVYQSGMMMDRLGRAKVLVLGFLIAIVGCILTGLAVAVNNLPIMIVGLLV